MKTSKSTIIELSDGFALNFKIVVSYFTLCLISALVSIGTDATQSFGRMLSVTESFDVSVVYSMHGILMGSVLLFLVNRFRKLSVPGKKLLFMFFSLCLHYSLIVSFTNAAE